MALLTYAWVRTWNDEPKPFIWTETAAQIPDSIGRLISRVDAARLPKAA